MDLAPVALESSTARLGFRVMNSTFFTPPGGAGPSLITCSSVRISRIVERSMKTASSASTAAISFVPRRACIAFVSSNQSSAMPS